MIGKSLKFIGIALVAAIGGYVGTLWMTPSFIMDRAWLGLSDAAGVNNMLHLPMVGAARRGIVRPSPDLAYSICPFDLSKGPLQVHAEPVPGHYWSLTVFDSATNAVLVQSDRDTEGKAVDVALVREGQRPPDGFEPFGMPSDKGIALVRVLLNDRGEFPEVAEIRAGSSCKTIKS